MPPRLPADASGDQGARQVAIGTTYCFVGDITKMGCVGTAPKQLAGIDMVRGIALGEGHGARFRGPGLAAGSMQSPHRTMRARKPGAGARWRSRGLNIR